MEELLKQFIEGQKQLIESVSNIEQNIATKDNLAEVRQSLARIENDHGTKLTALFDNREVQFDVNERLISTLDRMEAKIDVLQLESASLRRVK